MAQKDDNRHVSRPDSGWQLLQALISLILMVCGLIGIAIHVFGSDSSPYDWWHWMTDSLLNSALVVLAIIAVIIFHRYITHISNQKRRNASDLPVYAMMLLGAYFIYHLLMTGQW